MRSDVDYEEDFLLHERTIDWIVSYAEAYAAWVDAYIAVYGPMPSLGVPPHSDDIPRYYVPTDAACAWHHVLILVDGAPFYESLHPCAQMRLIGRLRDGRDQAHCMLLSRKELLKSKAAAEFQRFIGIWTGIPDVPWSGVFGI